METVTIASFFTKNGKPATNLESQTGDFPKVRIWRVKKDSNDTDQFIGEFTMKPVDDGSNDDGFYDFVFGEDDGYDPKQSFVFRADGGSALPDNERYQAGSITEDTTDLTVNAIWDEPLSNHQLTGSTGGVLSRIKADSDQITSNLFLSANSVLEVVHTLLKLEAGRTLIDANDSTLTIYDQDCVTPLRVYRLLDSEGNQSIEEVCERKPISKGDGDNTSLTDPC